MKYGYTFLLLLWTGAGIFGQSLVSFQTLPRDLQLFPRNAASQAVMLVEGDAIDVTVGQVTVQLWRAGKLSQTQKITLTSSRTFRFEVPIKAELAEYTIRVFAYRQPTDSVLVAERKRLLCGDMFLIYGQSNALGLGNLDKITVNDQFMRQCGYSYDAPDITSGMQWYPALLPYAAVGAFGLYLGEAIQKTTQIPVGFINGAEGGASIGQLADRNAANPADLNTFYGRMLYRAQWSGFQKLFKAIIYRQGEAEAGSSPVGYPANFDRFYRFMRQDYGNTPRFYADQINVLTGGSAEAGALRDFQRRLPDIYPDGVGGLATVGSTAYDGLHYNLPGNQQMGYEQGRQILRDVYGSGASEQVNSPNVRQVYQNSRNDTLTVVFETAMQLRWPPDSTLTRNGQTYTRRLLDVWLADGQAGRFVGGWADANRVNLVLRPGAAVQTLSYFPPFYGEGPSGFYDGPTLKNQLGMRAFTFDRYPVARALAAPNNLAVNRTTQQDITLSWTVPATEAATVLLERSGNGRVSFEQVAQLPMSTTQYTDRPTGSGVGPYAYRIRLASLRAESGVSNVAQGQLLPSCNLAVTISGASAVSFGGTLTLSANATGSVAGPPLTYQWAGPGGALTTTRDLTQQGLTPGLTGLYSVTVTQGVCSAMAATSVTIQTPLALEPTLSLSIWPNPAHSGQLVHLNLPAQPTSGKVTVSLLDMAGRLVLCQQLGAVTSLPLLLPALPAGHYVVSLKEGETGGQTCRLLVK